MNIRYDVAVMLLRFPSDGFSVFCCFGKVSLKYANVGGRRRIYGCEFTWPSLRPSFSILSLIVVLC